MTKKKHHEQPVIKLSKHAESKIERQTRIQRIITIAGAAFLGVVLLVVSIGLYMDRVAPRNEAVLRVNYRTFDLGYYLETLKLYSQGMEESQVASIADSVLSQMVRGEIIRQAAPSEGVVITEQEVEDEIERAGVDDSRVMRDMAEASLASVALTERFQAEVPAEMEQVRFEIMLAESRSVATEVQNALGPGVSLTTLTSQYSASPDVPVVNDWVPYEVLSNKDVAAALQTLQPNQSAVVHDATVAKNIGYWLIEIIDRDDTGAIKPRAMLCTSLEDALRAKERLATEDFAEVAKQYSQIYAMTENAEFDWVTPEDIVTVAFNEVAFDLELNVVSDPIKETEIQTTGGYWVVRLLERDTRAPYDNVAAAMASSAFDVWYQEVSATAVVEQLLTTEQKAWALERLS
ncbi:MAG: peptidylprolyl isomerase [Dehalococcoidia bacterium]|nr:peptidylprolyl isomerase [Dehalococcoidia bacterium]